MCNSHKLPPERGAQRVFIYINNFIMLKQITITQIHNFIRHIDLNILLYYYNTQVVLVQRLTPISRDLISIKSNSPLNVYKLFKLFFNG